MSRRDQNKEKWMIHREYIPDRLSPRRLADAYEKVVPKHIRVVARVMEEIKVRAYEQWTRGG